MKNLLLWEKWRPKKIDDIILLPRIKSHFEDGVKTNYIFHGHYGTGKTTLARILIGKYSKDKAFLELNSSLFTSIDVLRNEVEKFCKTQPMLETDDPIKYVFLDEFERVSSQYQDAMKAFIETYHKNVRFILTTNHINKISDGIKSRFTCIDFDYQDSGEEKLLKQELYKNIINTVIENYDLIVIDCPPALGQSVTAATLASDTIIFPLTPEKFSLSGLEISYKEISTINKRFNTSCNFKILLNKFDMRTALSSEVLAKIMNHALFQKMTFNTFIRSCQDFPNMLYATTNIFSNTKYSAAKDDIDLLTKEILNLNIKK